ncbi:MAG TPA: hypothetical protein VFR76_01420 [Verrucomicrobiae bacterium]|nr:hypothetical protein [Verrucomicrobiae bacterium]
MNLFVNPKKRGFLLPGGCKDLMDVLQLSERKRQADRLTPAVRSELEVGTLAHIHRHLEKLSSFVAQFTVLAMVSMDGRMRVVLERSADELRIYPVMGLAEAEKDAEDFFSARAIQPCIDFLVGNPGKPTRVLSFPLPFDPSKASEVTSDLIRSVYGLDADAEIEFVYVKTAAA